MSVEERTPDFRGGGTAPPAMNLTALAYLGDAVYETAVRETLLKESSADVNKVHRQAVELVRAESQAYAVRALEDFLTEEEKDLVRRARNRRILSRPRNVDPVTYKLATAFEALVGSLYLTDRDRMALVAARAVEAIRSRNPGTDSRGR